MGFRLKLILALGFIQGIGWLFFGWPLPGADKSPRTSRASKADVMQSIKAYNNSLPMSLDNRLRLDKVAYQNNLVSYTGVQLWKQDLTESERHEVGKSLRQQYCAGALKPLSKADVPVEFAFTTQPRSLSDLSTETWKVKVFPGECN